MPSTFKKSLPIVIPSFINKSGTIGLNLLPMLLVERAYSLKEATTVMTSVKAMAFVGTFLGGWFSDRWGPKSTLLFSFSAAGVGLIAMPWAANEMSTLIVAACLAQLGTSLFSGPARLLLTGLAAPHERQEAIGWLRAANNLGQVISNLVGSLAASLGIGFLMMFDGSTSLLAAAVGAKWLPAKVKSSNRSPGKSSGRSSHVSSTGSVSTRDLPSSGPAHSSEPPLSSQPAPPISESDKAQNLWPQFLLTTVTTAGFSFLYEVFIVGAAAQGRTLYGEDGIRLFAQMMVINTILCAGLAIWASRRIQNPRLAFASGIFATMLGISLAIHLEWSHSGFFIAMFFVTLGEILFTAVSSHRLIQVLPETTQTGSIYGVALTIQRLGTVMGGALAFALIVHRNLSIHWVWLIAFVTFLLALFQNPKIETTQ